MPLLLIQMNPVDPKRKRFSGLWRNPDFLKLWTGQTISILGSHITAGGLPLLALITLQSTPFQMGLLQAIGSAPVLLFSLAAGVWVDRLRRKPVMIAADLGRAFILMTIPLAAAFGWLSIGQIYIVIALAGFLNVLFNTAYRAYLPALVERENIVEGNAKLSLSESAAEVVGPGLTGVLVQTITAPVAILFDALSFLFSVVTLAAIRKPEPAPLPAEAHQSMYHEARQGMRMLFQQPVLLALTAEAATSSFFGNFIGVLYALYAIRELGLSPAAIGITIGVGGVSSLVGAILAERVMNKPGLGPMLIRFFFIDTLFGFLIPIAASFPSLGLGFLLFSQCGDIFGTIYRIHTLSLRQSLTPTHLQGRVNASIELLTAGVAPIGALLGGVLGQKLGVQATLFIAVIGISLSGLWLVFSPIRKMKNFPSSETGS
jgi:predicted MFS family arabinose efflux permease